MTPGPAPIQLDVCHRGGTANCGPWGSGHTSRERVGPGGTGTVRSHVADLRLSTGHRSGSLSSLLVPEASCWQRPSVLLVQESSSNASSAATARPRSGCMAEPSASARPPDYRRRNALRRREARLRDDGRDTACGTGPPGCVPCRPPLRIRRRGAWHEQAGRVSRRVLQAAVPPAAVVFDFAPEVLAAKF